MMETQMKLIVLALAAALLSLVVKKQSPELGLGLSLCACVLGAALVLDWVRPVLGLAQSLAREAELEEELTEPLWKCLGIGLLTELSAAVCADAGQSALARLVELGGALLCLVLGLPLVQAVLALIRELL